MNAAQARAMALAIIGPKSPRSNELRAWLEQGVMSASQAARLGRRSRPSCFSSDSQWVAWCIHEAQRPVSSAGFCYDCTARYKAQMLHNLKCQYPLTTFVTKGQAPDQYEVGQHPAVRRAPPR